MRKLDNKVTHMQMAYRHEVANESMVEKAVMLQRNDFKDSIAAKTFRRLFFLFALSVVVLAGFIGWMVSV